MTRNSRRSGHNEREYVNSDGSISVVYHGTEIVWIGPDGRVILNTGGWLTVSTMAHIRKALVRHRVPGTVSRAGGVFSFFRFRAAPVLAETLYGDGPLGAVIVVPPCVRS